MHESNLGWAAHVVHHSSMDYNYTVALRQGFGESIVSGQPGPLRWFQVVPAGSDAAQPLVAEPLVRSWTCGLV